MIPSTYEPYVGLRAFRTEESDKFFGREQEAYELSDLWQSNRMTVLHAPSGTGKTSLIQAGVLPLIEPYKADALPIGRVSHGTSFPTPALPEHNPHVFALLSSWAPQEAPMRLARMTVRDFLRRRHARYDPYGDPALVLIAIDQAEELFLDTFERHPYCEWLIDQLVEALDDDPNLRLLFSIREDRLSDLLAHELKLAGVDREHFRLAPLSCAAAVRAVEGPLEGTFRSFAGGVADQLVQDLRMVDMSAAAMAPDGTPPLLETVDPVRLQVACATLWHSLPADVTLITSAHVRRFALTDSSLTEFGDGVVARVAEKHAYPGGAAALKRWLRGSFVDQYGNRRRVYQGQTLTAGVPNAVVTALVDRNVLRVERAADEYWCELSHDRLVDWLLRVRRRTAPVAEPTAQDHLHRAELALAEGNLDLAREEAEQAAAAGVDDLQLSAEIESLLGNIAYKQNDFQRAIDHYLRAAELFTGLGGATEAVGRLLAAIGRILMYQGQPDQAVTELRAALNRVGGGDVSIVTQLSWALWYGGEKVRAKELLDGLLHQEGNVVEALRARGEILADLNESEAALRDLDLIRPLQHPSARAARALALAQLGRRAEAELEIAEALAEGPDHGTVLCYAARLRHLLDKGTADKETAGEETAAAVLARRALTAPPPPLPAHLRKEAEKLAGKRPQP
ncbi:tetratricopeptide repeat protein [Acrocarpospora catenulata]|uniref:tetratricopeptide repeat protein n=1 Tax=Acrocarpospora catenulata TaxID=2836182 RepID=UPI001BDAF88D|nr:tetratricopeptide repeat protein [Acrocarpospora catenulata]